MEALSNKEVDIIALRNMILRVGADVTGLRQGLKNAQKDVAFFGRNVTGSMKELQGNIAKVGAAIGGGLLLKSGIQDAMRFEALMTTLGETLGSSRKEFEKWQKSTGNAMGFSMLQSAELANMLSLNFKSISTSTADLTNKTTKMMELAAVISNKRGMAMTEVSDRIRSAMNQEADGAMELGVDVRIAAIKAGQAYQEMANGQPWDKLTENMRKTILYHHIFEQVNKNLGMTMQDTTAQRMSAFTATLTDLRMALGQAFLPIMYTVLPLLTKMAQALLTVLQVVGAFMRSLFGGGFKYKAPVTSGDVATTKAQTVALGDMGNAAAGAGKKAEGAGKKSAKAADKAKKAWSGTMGFDEVNTIKAPDPTAGAGAGAGGGGGGGGGIGGGGGGISGGGGLAVPTPDFGAFEQKMSALQAKMKKYTDPIKKVFKQVWGAVSGFAKEEFAKITKWWNENGAQIIQGAKNAWALIGPIIMAVLKFIWDSVKMIVDGVITTFMGIVEFFTGIFTGDFKMAWEGLKKIFFGVLEALMGFWNLSFVGGIKKVLFTFLKDGIKRLGTFIVDFKGVFSKGIDSVIGFFKKLAKGIKDQILLAKNFIDGKIELMQTGFGKFWKAVEKGASTAVKGLKKVWGVVVEWFKRTIINPIVAEFDNISKAFSKGPVEGIKYLINRLIDGFNNALKTFNNLKNKTPFANKIPDLKIPHLARGGITNGPTLAMVGDNRGGQEVISPLDKLQGIVTNSVIQAMQLSGGNRNSGDIVLNIDGRSFARIVKPFLDKEQGRVGNDVRIKTI